MMTRHWLSSLTATTVFLLVPYVSLAQLDSSVIKPIFETPAIPGNEEALAGEIRWRLSTFSPVTDSAGNVYVTLGSGSPHRLIATAMDEPGYVVSAITPDGFLRVQRLPQQAPNPVFDSLHAAQPVWVMAHGVKQIPGVIAGLSVHLQSARLKAPKMANPEDIYVDVGAASEAEVRAAGIGTLDPLVLNRTLQVVGLDQYSGPAVGDRFGCIVLLDLLHKIERGQVKGTITFAFVAQQHAGGRGLDHLLNEMQPDEMIFVGRLVSPRSSADKATAGSAQKPGSGVLLGVTDPSAAPANLVGELARLASENKISTLLNAAAPPRSGGYGKPAALPQRFAQISVATLWPMTPAETVALSDLQDLEQLLVAYVHAAVPKRKQVEQGNRGAPDGWGGPPLPPLIRSYGASGHEQAVRETVKGLLPELARNRATTDPAGNLVLHIGDAKPGTKAPKLAFVAHLDELGYGVKAIEPDGRLLVEPLGGFYPQYFLGHVVLVHKKDGSGTGGVLELPEGWDKPGFEWPSGPKAEDAAAHVYVGTHSAKETAKLGIAPDDWVTIPKEYRPLLGTRANGRSFDDRVGCAALIDAVRALGPDLPGRDVTFVWSTQEEVGLYGAAAFAEQAAKEKRIPDFVFAIDTFVSADSPLESKRYADAKIGEGFVIRAVDNSNITPREYVNRVVQLAHENNIPVQYGVTGGGNDGSVFTRYGSVDIPLGWPLRYSHSPAEVIDTRDADALGKIVAVIAKNW